MDRAQEAGAGARLTPGPAPKTAEAYRAEVADTDPQKRLIQPQEIASLVVLPCRDEALGITAGNIRVSAGSLW